MGMGLQGPAGLMGTRAVAPGLTFPTGRRCGVGSLCSGPGPGEHCWFLKPGESPWLVFVWRILGQDLVTRSCPVFPAGSWDGGPSTQTPRWWLRVKAEKVKLDSPTLPAIPQAGCSLGGTSSAPGNRRGGCQSLPGVQTPVLWERLPDTDGPGCHDTERLPCPSVPAAVRGTGQALASPFYRSEH